MKAPFIPASGVALALAAAGLAFTAAPASAKAKPGEQVELVHCSGVNACKGHNDCKTADNACKGQGSCKGKGFVAASKTACSDIGGNRVDPKVKFSADAGSQVKCYGVNACKGHNDCKTADNACKGHGSCKGKGFVALPATSCSHVGGNAG
ncbi:MAG TPA: hypothetical protein VIT62_11845 [Lysobacter sp.]